MKYPLLDDVAPWSDTAEIAFDMDIDGDTVQGVPFFTDLTDHLQLGLGFEAMNPYVNVAYSQIVALGILSTIHGRTLTFDGRTFRIRNIVTKEFADLLRLELEER